MINENVSYFGNIIWIRCDEHPRRRVFEYAGNITTKKNPLVEFCCSSIMKSHRLIRARQVALGGWLSHSAQCKGSHGFLIIVETSSNASSDKASFDGCMVASAVDSFVVIFFQILPMINRYSSEISFAKERLNCEYRVFFLLLFWVMWLFTSINKAVDDVRACVYLKRHWEENDDRGEYINVCRFCFIWIIVKECSRKPEVCVCVFTFRANWAVNRMTTNKEKSNRPKFSHD